jgi:hypothetical protein
MNERIQELAEQAWRATSDEVAHLNRMHNRAISHDEQMDVFEQKFAELIVRECVVLSENYYDGLSPDDHECFTCRKVAYTIADRIKEHFGVE